MKRDFTVFRRAYHVLPALPVAYSYIMLLNRMSFWPAYRVMAIGWGVGFILAYLFDANSGNPAPRYSRYKRWGRFYNVGWHMPESVWAVFALEAVAFSFLGLFTSGFLKPLLAFFLSIPVSLLYLLLTFLLPNPRGGSFFKSYPMNPTPGYGDEPESRFGDGLPCTYSDGVRGPANTGYLSGYPGRTWSEKHDNWLNR